jgi:ABC-type multidrug transport system ATPase subunit
MATHISPSSGTLKIFCADAFKNSKKIKRHIGFVAHNSFLYNELTVEENLLFYKRMFSVSQNIQELVNLLNLERWKNLLVKQVSHGVRKRADIARALIHNPDILLFDELLTGLDEETRRQVIYYFTNQKKKTILMSTHSIEWAKQLCDRALYLDHGKLIQDIRF